MCIRDRYQRRVHGIINMRFLVLLIALAFIIGITFGLRDLEEHGHGRGRGRGHHHAEVEETRGGRGRGRGGHHHAQEDEERGGRHGHHHHAEEERGGRGHHHHHQELNSSNHIQHLYLCLLYTSPSPRDQRGSRMPSSA
eukprot:TRINITY_DN561_c0_g1_i6.p1 TRINITY_DN561_c0_g1~~TRINITY_DN561_c0_g1_i6.p1  ORF type:complete len:139 (+),score=41.72 TRINITY_DN561_c0_g1_i6:63-479(+)